MVANKGTSFGKTILRKSWTNSWNVIP